jgi:hypothetical protein
VKCLDTTVATFTAATMALLGLVVIQHITGHAAITDTIPFHDALVAEHTKAFPVFILEPVICVHNGIIFIVHPQIYGKIIDKSAKFFLGYTKKCWRC